MTLNKLRCSNTKITHSHEYDMQMSYTLAKNFMYKKFILLISSNECMSNQSRQDQSGHLDTIQYSLDRSGTSE